MADGDLGLLPCSSVSGSCQPARAPILTRLWARTACPAQIRAPSVPSIRVRSQPYPRLRLLIRPSLPVRHFTDLRNAGRCSMACRALPGLPLRGITTVRTPRSYNAWSTFASGVAAVCGDGAGLAAGASDDALHRWRQLRGVGRVALFQGVVQHDTVVVVDDLGLVAELNRFAQAALGDRAGVTVVQADPPGRPGRGHPAQPLPGWAATRRVTSSSSVRSLTARRSRPRRRPRRRRRHRPRPALRPLPAPGAGRGGRCAATCRRLWPPVRQGRPARR